MGDFIKIKHGYPFKSQYFTDKGYYHVLSLGSFYEKGGFKYPALGKEKHTTENFPEEYILKKGDLIVAMTEQVLGLLGSTAWIPEDDKWLLNQRIGLVTCDETIVNNYFVYYLFATKNVREQISRPAQGTKQRNTSPESIYDVKVWIPKLQEQKAIANILHTMDCKITINNAINAELEKVAKTLYNYWFVQFDFPNAKGKYYRASGGKMVYNDVLKREIPEGWEVISFSEILNENKQVLPEDVNKAQMFGLDLSIMPSNTICLNQRGKANDFDSNRFLLKKYDLLFGSIRPYLKKAGFATFDGVVNGTVMNFRCNKDQDYSFALCTLTSEMMFKYAITRSSGNGTRMPTINASELLDYCIAYDEQTVAQFENILSSYWKMIADNINQNFELSELRDFLLPLLMNGQVKVKG